MQVRDVRWLFPFWNGIRVYFFSSGLKADMSFSFFISVIFSTNRAAKVGIISVKKHFLPIFFIRGVFFCLICGGKIVMC
jgi:hypothetical protein